MLRFSKKRVSVSVILDRRRAKVSGLYPVKIEVVFDRKQKYFPTGVDLSEQEWSEMDSRRRHSPRIAEIEENFSRVRNEVADMLEKGPFSFRILEVRLGRSSKFNVNRALKLMMDKCRADGRVNSFYRCRSTLKNLENFSGTDIAFSDVNAAWLERCEKFWRSEGKSGTTVEIYMKTLKVIFNQARRKGYIKETPFGRENGYVIPRGSARKLALTKEQIRKVIEYHGPEKLELYRDLWLFSYLCNGINFRDMLFLRYGNLIDGEIRFIRSKTEHAYKDRKIIYAVLVPEMKNIICRWGNPDDGSPDTLLFKFAEGLKNEFDAAMLVRKVISQCNQALKEIARDIGIPAFTTYSARHSFATVMQRSGAALPYISECLGHSSLSMTEAYLAGFGPEERLRNSALLTDFK